MSRNKNRFRSKRKGKSPSFNTGPVGVSTAPSIGATTMYTVTEDRETLMGIMGNLSVRPSSANGVAWFSIQILRALPSVTALDPQEDSVGIKKYIRLWDWVVHVDAAAVESTDIAIVSKKRRKLYVGDAIILAHLQNVANVALFAIQIRGFQILML